MENQGWTIESIEARLDEVNGRLASLDEERKALRRVAAGLEAWLEIAKRNAQLLEG